MKCAACHAENKPGRRFCAQCGHALDRICAACGYANDPADRFCGGCGANLDQLEPQTVPEVQAPLIIEVPPVTEAPPVIEAPPATEASLVAAAPPTERRPVAVLFADLSNYSRISNGRDPEEIQRLLGRFFELVDRAIADFGGTVDKHIGDAVMGLFGAPVAHGDDSLRAARAAIAIHEAMESLSREMNEALTVHIGIALGEVVAGTLGSAEHAAYTVTGDTVNLAARLMEAAPAGQTWIDAETEAAIDGQLHSESLPSVDLRGFGMLTIHRLVGAAASTPAPRRGMIGRVAELGQIQALLDGARAEGRGLALLIRGDPGIGKSTLMREAEQVGIQSGFAVTMARALDFGVSRESEAPAVIATSLMRQLAGDPSDVPGVINAGHLPRKLEAFAADLLGLPQSEAAASLYRAMDEGMRERGRSRTLQALLAAAAQKQPQLILVEDVHWAESRVVQLLADLTRKAATVPAVILMSTRIDGDPIDASWRANAHEGLAATIDLRPLAVADATELVRQLANEIDEFAQRCIERAEGNPLFLEQLLRSRAAEAGGKLPPSLHGVVLARLDRLLPKDRRAAEAASVLGQRFDLGDLRRLIEDPAYEAEQLTLRHLVRPEGDEIAFAHALIRDGVYASITKDRRMKFHEAAARILFNRDPGLAAEHLERAEDPDAPQAYLRAAEAAAAKYHLTRAVALAERGLHLARSSSDIYALAMRLGALLRDLGQGEPALAAYDAARPHAVTELERANVVIGQASSNRLLGQVKVALIEIEEARPLIESIGSDLLAAEFHYLRGNLFFANGRRVDCAASHRLALEAAERAQSPEFIARALSGLGDAGYAEGRIGAANDYFERCVALADQHKLLRVSTPNRAMMADCQCFFMSFAHALALAHQSTETARRLGDLYLEMFGVESMSYVAWTADWREEAEQFATEALGLSRKLRADRYNAILLVLLASVQRHSKPTEELRAMCREAMELSERTSIDFCGPLVCVITALIEPDPDVQRAMMQRGEALLAKGSLSHNLIFFRRFAIDWAIENGHWSEVERYASQLDAHGRSTGESLPYVEFIAARARAIAALAQDPDDFDARDKIRQLRDQARACDFRISFPTLEE